MADNNFRSYRSRDPVAPEEFDSSREAAGDPLAELARLIGQGDPYAEGGRHERQSPAHADDDMTAPGLDWAADQAYAGEHDRAEDRYAPPPAASYPNLAPQDRVQEQDRVQDDEPSAGPRFLSGPAPNFDGFREDAAGEPRAGDRHDRGHDPAHDPAYYPAHDPDQLPPVSATRRLPAFASAAYDNHGDAGHQGHDGDQEYSADDDYAAAAQPRRRGGFILVMAVLALAVVGTAGAFGYRAMFGGSMLPKLPPIIKASNGPNKIMPNYGDSAASNASQTGAASTGSTEQLAAPAEQPVDIQQSVKTAPRVVSTIPIVPGANPVAPGAEAPVRPAPAAPAPFASAAAVAAPAAASLAVAPPPPMAAPAPAPIASEPKRVHTVTIRADRQSGRGAAVVAARKPSKSASALARANEPLSIVPAASGDLPASPAAHTRSQAAPLAVASTGQAARAEQAASSDGGYAVQVTSQRSAGEAHAAFRALRAKFPRQLGGREPIVRRADLGARGTYYRALVGPFASMEAAAEMCSSLKAAGGNCLVQRN